MARKLTVEIVGDASSLHRAYSGASKSADSFSSSLRKLGKAAAVTAGAAGIGGFFFALKSGISDWTESTKVAAQTNAVIKSTGGVANVTAKHVQSLATTIEHYSGVDDEAVKAGENVLLSFTNIRNGLGKNNKMFDDATKIVADFAVRTGRDVPQAALLLGKALEDPAGKMSSLSRAGVVFTDQQKEQIKQMQKSGDVVGAQALLMKALKERYEGAAEAAGKTLPGQLKILRERFNDFAGNLVGKVMPALTDFFGKLAEAHGFTASVKVIFTGIGDAFKKLREALFGGMRHMGGGMHGGGGAEIPFDGIIQKGIKSVKWGEVGKAIMDGFISGLKKAKEISGRLMEIINKTMEQIPWERFGDKMGPMFAGMVATGIAVLLDPGFWLRHWEEVLAVALAFFPMGKLVGGLGRVFKFAFAPLGKIIGPFLDDALRGAWSLAETGLLKAAEALGPRLGGVLLRGFDLIGPALGKLAGFFSKAWDDILGSVQTKLGGFWSYVLRFLAIDAIIHGVEVGVLAIAGWFGSLPGKVIAAFSGGWEATKGAFSRAWQWVKDEAGRLINPLISWFAGLPGRVGSAFSTAWGGISGFFTTSFGKITGWATTAISGVVGFFQKLPTKIGQAVLDFADDGWELVKKALAKIFGGAWKFVKGIFGINSPSSVFAELGKQVVAGFVKGMVENAGFVKSAAGKVFGAIGGQVDASKVPHAAGVDMNLLPRVKAALLYAMQQGWHGIVTSGRRSRAEQQYLWDHASELGLIRGVSVARPGTSMHEQGAAVDVTDRNTFASIMSTAPDFERLFPRGATDLPHFSITGHAKGGIITKPLHLFGEAGPEAVIPLNSPQAAGMMGGGGVTVNVTVKGALLGSTVPQVAETIRRELLRTSKRNGGVGLG